MKKLYVLLIFGATQAALAGGPQVKFFSEKLGSLESSVARDAIRSEINSKTDLGRCYYSFFSNLQFNLSKSDRHQGLLCYLRLMKMPLTLEITLDESIPQAKIEIPELKIRYISVRNVDGPHHSSCFSLAELVEKDLKSNKFPFKANFDGALVDEILASPNFFEKNECNSP